MGRPKETENEQAAEQQEADSFYMDLENREVKMANGLIDAGQRKGRISISAVVDIQTMDKPKYERLANTLMAVMNSKDVKVENATIHIRYEESTGVCKVLLWGSMEYINEMLAMITLLEQEAE